MAGWPSWHYQWLIRTSKESKCRSPEREFIFTNEPSLLIHYNSNALSHIARISKYQWCRGLSLHRQMHLNINRSTTLSYMNLIWPKKTR